jgi:hypothetical protein
VVLREPAQAGAGTVPGIDGKVAGALRILRHNIRLQKPWTVFLEDTKDTVQMAKPEVWQEKPLLAAISDVLKSTPFAVP